MWFPVNQESCSSTWICSCWVVLTEGSDWYLWTGLGYHKDLQTRATFMEVLTKILQQGTEFDTLAETVLADRFERLVELVTMMGDQGELPIAMALANVVPCSQWVRDRTYCTYFTVNNNTLIIIRRKRSSFKLS